jgi:hypothetical protein
MLSFEQSRIGRNVHCDIVEDLRGVVDRTGRATFCLECRRDSVQRILVVRERTPVGSVDDEDGEGECCVIVNMVGRLSLERGFDILFPRTNSARPAITMAIHPKK